MVLHGKRIRMAGVRIENRRKLTILHGWQLNIINKRRESGRIGKLCHQSHCRLTRRSFEEWAILSSVRKQAKESLSTKQMLNRLLLGFYGFFQLVSDKRISYEASARTMQLVLKVLLYGSGHQDESK